MATQGVFTLPANTQFGVTAFANSAGTQTVNVQVNNETVATFTGQSTNNGIIGSKVLNSGGGGKVQILVSVNGRSSDLVSAQVILANELNFALVGSEDSTDNDYNDAVVVINWPLGWRRKRRRGRLASSPPTVIDENRESSRTTCACRPPNRPAPP